jgi:hypothetical protein
VETPSDFPEKMYTLQKKNLKDALRYFSDRLQKTMPGTFLNVVKNMISLGDEFAGLHPELVKYVKFTSAALESLDKKGIPPEIVPPFSALFLCTYRTIRIKSKPIADRWLRQAVTKHKKFLTTHGILAKLPPDVDIASL